MKKGLTRYNFRRFDFPGFTLIEAVLVIFVFSIVFLIISNLFIGQNNLYNFFMTEVRSGQAARLAMDRMVETSRQAEVVLDSHDFSGTVYASGPQVMVARLKSVDAGDEFITNSFDYVAYYLDSGNPRRLLEKLEANASSKRLSATRVLANNVYYLNFSYTPSSFSSAKEILISITAAEKYKNSTSSTILTATAKLRDKN